MSDSDRKANNVQDLKGRAKEAAGSITGNDNLKDKGRKDQAKASVKNAAESVKDAAGELKKVIKP
jgi:uncharacterized protein YjbJ (UPF0337 family)